MSDHAWVQENLDAYATGGLSVQERSRVDHHLASCSACAHVKTEILEMEQLMEGLFMPVRPDVGLEDRVITKLRRARKPRPSWLRFVTAAAAVLVLGLVGGGVQMWMSGGVVPLPGMKNMSAQAFLFGNEKEGLEGLGFIGGTKLEESKKASFGTVDIDPAKPEADTDIQYMVERLPDVSVPGSVQVNMKVGIVDGDKQSAPVNFPAPSGLRGGGALERNSYASGKAKVWDKGKDKELNARFYDDVVQESKEKLDKDLKDSLGGETKRDDKLRDLEGKPGDMRETPGDDKKPIARPSMQTAKALPNFYSNYAPGASASVATTSSPMAMGGGGASSRTPVFDAPKMVADNKGLGGHALPCRPAAGWLLKRRSFPPPVTLSSKPAATETPPSAKADDPNKLVGDGLGKKDPQPVQAQPAKEPPPEKTGRMIIRTGEMEFETDSFDNTVDAITKLITGVKGGFIATINSDKLANGKMKGAVIVRMPPTLLDKFIYDLRRELAKTSELKNQRLGSLDVTKQYTDIESRLRAARALEERLIAIIKTGKGEIKDLVAAEKELGVWRTKIEEMEGEIRYYANQVSLSTLTISLFEKEIQAPTAIVVTETVIVRIEADEVAKAHQAAMKAVEDLKGRITRSELKQHTAGQFLSTVHADIPPAKKQAFIEELKKLGIVSDFQENQRQHTEGGTGPAPALKPKQNDVRFEVTMHNTANIRPRLSADLKVATTDVPGAYAKLLDKIAKVKGQVRDGKLNEQDKLNVHAQLDFNVPTAEKAGIDKLLDEIGPTLERINIQAPISELSTPSKFGYIACFCADFASIPPRQVLVQIVATIDVQGAYGKIQDAIAKAKGQVADAKLNEQEKNNVNASPRIHGAERRAKGDGEAAIRSRHGAVAQQRADAGQSTGDAEEVRLLAEPARFRQHSAEQGDRFETRHHGRSGKLCEAFRSDCQGLKGAGGGTPGSTSRTNSTLPPRSILTVPTEKKATHRSSCFRRNHHDS